MILIVFYFIFFLQSIENLCFKELLSVCFFFLVVVFIFILVRFLLAFFYFLFFFPFFQNCTCVFTVCTSGFQCDNNRCIPVDWLCDGHLDCADHSDEIGCGECGSIFLPKFNNSNKGDKRKFTLSKNTQTKATLHCGERRCMSASHICDGVMDCPWGQDERYCRKIILKISCLFIYFYFFVFLILKFKMK